MEWPSVLRRRRSQTKWRLSANRAEREIAADDAPVSWTNAERHVVCRIYELAPGLYDVRVMADNVTVASRTFLDGVEAADEAERLRRRFIS